MTSTVFHELRKLFFSRFFHNESSAGGDGLETSLYQLLGLLATPGILAAMALLPTFFAISAHARAGYEWELRADRLFFAAWSFSATGFATFFEWDMLFPDRRDFLILTPFPVRPAEIFGAKLAALGMLLAGIVAATNLPSALLLPVISMGLPDARQAGLARVLAAQAASTGAAALFAFLAVAGLQGLMVNVLNPRLFRKVSPAVQMAGMSLMILSLLLFPLYSMMMRSLAAQHPDWMALFPCYWFTGLYEIFVPGPGLRFRELGWLGIRATAVAALVFCACWAAGFRRHYRRTLEAEDTAPRRRSLFPGMFDWMPDEPGERGIFRFAVRTLAGSLKHRLFLASYVSVGFSFGILSVVSLRKGQPGISAFGARAWPMLVLFFVVSGFRTAFQFPAEPACNWLFRICDTGWERAAARATRKAVLAMGILPAVTAFLPFEVWYWGIGTGLGHALFEVCAGVLLTEVLFWNFPHVPFTCAYSPGRVHLVFLAGAYLYGFTNYAFRMAELGVWLDAKGFRMIGFVLGSAVVTAAWQRLRRAGEPVRFESARPELEALDLS